MTATANIQNGKNTAAQQTNKIMEDGEMNNGNNNIKMVTRLTNGFRRSKISKLAVGAAIGLVLTAGVAMSIPDPARSGGVATNLNDDFSLVYGTPDNGHGTGSVSKSAPARVTENTGTFDWSDDFSLVYGIPDTASVAGRVELSGFGPGEENFHPITGELTVAIPGVAGYAGMSEENLESVFGRVELSGFGLAEENFHPITGELTVAIPGVAGYAGMSEENLEPVAGRVELSGFGLAEENFHPITGEMTVPLPGGDAIVPTAFSVASYADMSEENREIVPASSTVAGYGDMSEENLEIVN